MKLAHKLLVVASCTLWQHTLKAETLEVEYASFYSHVKKLDDPETDALRFAFGFAHITQARLCQITSASIVTQKQTLALLVENNNRFTVPTDKILKMAKAMVEIELDDSEQANQCDMSVQLETLPAFLKREYRHEELIKLLKQYQAFFKEMGGFLSFLMPSPQGLTIHFEQDVVLPQSLQPLSHPDGSLRLTEKWLSQETGIKLPAKPLRVTAILDK